MKEYIDILLLSIIVVFIVDMSGWTDTLLSALSRWSGRKVRSLRPLTCSLCATWWSGVAYCIATHHIDMAHLAAVAVVAFFATTIADVLRLIKDIITRLINKLY